MPVEEDGPAYSGAVLKKRDASPFAAPYEEAKAT